MLNLPDVTLLSIDTINPLRSIKAMQYSMLQVNFGAAVLVTAREAFRPGMLSTIGGCSRIDRIRVEFEPAGPREDYERQIVQWIAAWCATSHCLLQEWDSAVMNPAAWNPMWLNYDFIGAPWPYLFEERGYPVCTESNCVGNGGFSLRSRGFALETKAIFERRGRPKEALRLSDAWICRTIRPELEAAGMKFAPEDEAARFSCENRFYSGQFGMHGKNTIAMNGWKWDFEWLQ